MGTRVYFGNVSINKLQEIMGIELIKDDYEWLKQHHSESVNYDNKGFHIFELPSLQIHCGDDIVDERKIQVGYNAEEITVFIPREKREAYIKSIMNNF